MDTYRAALESKRSELERSLRNREDIVIAQGGDEVEHIHEMTNREMALHNKEKGSALLKEVREALSRLDEDTFGTCLECDEPISPKRLQAVPWAALCVSCQEREDRNKRSEYADLIEDVA